MKNPSLSRGQKEVHNAARWFVVAAATSLLMIVPATAQTQSVVPMPGETSFKGQSQFDRCLAIGYLNDAGVCTSIEKFGVDVAMGQRNYKATWSPYCHTHIDSAPSAGDFANMIAWIKYMRPQTDQCRRKIVDPNGPPVGG